MEIQGTNQLADTPKKGERFYCHACGMSLEITKDCACSDKNMVHFECCGKAMQKPDRGSDDAGVM